MIPADLAALRDELDTDPLGLGYAARQAAGGLQAVADALNWSDPGWPGAGRAPRSRIDRGDFLRLTTPAVFRLASMPDAVRWAWGEVRADARATEWVDLGPDVVALVRAAVGQGVLTAEESAAILTEPAGRAAVVLGRRAAVSAEDVAAAIAGPGSVEAPPAPAGPTGPTGPGL